MNTRPDLPALTAGLALAVFGASGLLNSTGLATHPGWIPPALVVGALAAAATARSLLVLLRPPGDDPSTGAA